MQTLPAHRGASTASSAPIRRRLELRGRVQGVGLRPFAWRLADELGLAGKVGNHAQGAWVEVEGAAPQVERFIQRLRTELPAPGRIDALEARALALDPAAQGFQIQASALGGPASAEVLPDLSLCADCLRELSDPADRRYRYPFINCSHCGPRYSIVLGLPYDRASTTMAHFELCPACNAEYHDPKDRRFHAQPVACPACGPRLWFAEPGGAERAGDALALAAALLSQGGIVALKGIGGFHLACRADDEAAVERLRRRKGRDAKPFAVMVPDLEEARRLAVLDPASEAALSSPARPIVLAPKAAEGRGLCPAVAPGSGHWGLLLPYSPLHHLLLAEAGLPLVMTSGNPSGEPLCADNAEALQRLGAIADGFLLHDREIARRVDDSVLLRLPAVGGGAELLPLRRARGYVPAALRLDAPVAAPVLAVGGQMKSALCLLAGDRAVMSEHLGELEQPAAYRNFLGALERLQDLLQARPVRLAADLHPLYAATRWAEAQGLPLTLVQHHHAHIASGMAEHGLRGPVIGVALDGTGYGPDHGIWGCEILVCDRAAWRRAGHLAPFELQGGDAASQECWRPALGLLKASLPKDWKRQMGGLRRLAGAAAVDLAARRLEQGQGAVACSSAGRLFDGVAALLGICADNRYEAEAAQALQRAAEDAGPAEPLPFGLREPAELGEAWVLDPAPMLRALLDGGAAGRLARGFHEGLAQALALACQGISRQTGVQAVVLSGGCFANALLLEGLRARLLRAGLQVFTHRQVPCGDGGLALGQAVVAAESH
jgi:hydrogenase maturation protein HypF